MVECSSDSKICLIFYDVEMTFSISQGFQATCATATWSVVHYYQGFDLGEDCKKAFFELMIGEEGHYYGANAIGSTLSRRFASWVCLFGVEQGGLRSHRGALSKSRYACRQRLA